MVSVLESLLAELGGCLSLDGERVSVRSETSLRTQIERLVEISALEEGERQAGARYLTRLAALDLGIIPSSIHDLYMARGRGDVPLTFTVPAINLRVLPFDAARAAFRAAMKVDAAALIFEIARSEIGYTAQRPAEYATAILAAAIAEGYRGPVFLQGDHFQVSVKRYQENAEAELTAVRDLTREAIVAGFFNIDVDTSTLVDVTLPDVSQQQRLNYELSAMFAAYIRRIEPRGVTVSIGGEIGEVGGHNSTEPELRAYMDGFNAELAKRSPGSPGLSKISIQTGTSHGGVVLPDGTIARVKVDFDTLRNLSRVARSEYGLAGTVQHGASTLPQDAFGKFVEAEACEVHLATNFMNIFYDRAPDDLRKEMYAWLDANKSTDRKPDQTDEQFYYKTRKYALGPFKRELYALPSSFRDELSAVWEEQFDMLFAALGVANTRRYVEKFVTPVAVQPTLADYLGGTKVEENTDDLAD